MNKLKALYLTACTASLLWAGCADTQRCETIEQIPVPNIDKAAVVRTAEDVLRRMHFTIDKADANRGLVRTKPLPGAQFFEFWRSDNVGSFNSLQANIHSIRRTVELNVNSKGEKLLVTCNATVERLSLPEHEVSSSARAYAMFSKSTASLQNLRLHPEQEKRAAWLNLGRDGELETMILKHIERKLAAEGQPPQDTKSL